MPNRLARTSMNGGERRADRFQQHHQVIDQIGGLLGDASPVAGHGGESRLDRLLANLLGAFLDAFGEELGGVGFLRRGGAAVADDAGELPSTASLRPDPGPRPDATRPRGGSECRPLPCGPWLRRWCRCRNGRSRRRARPRHDRRARRRPDGRGVPTPPRGDHRDADGVGNGADQARCRSPGRCRRGPSRSTGSRRHQVLPPSRAKSTASSPVGRRPPWVKISKRGGAPAATGTRLASMATTMHWAPNFRAASAHELAGR